MITLKLKNFNGEVFYKNRSSVIVLLKKKCKCLTDTTYFI